MIHPKDVPVLAAAVASKATYLITLDRRHFLTKAVSDKVPDLEALLGRRVDVVEPEGLYEPLRAVVLKETVPL